VSDHNHKSARRLVHLLTRSASAGANLLLNVGPTAEGEILPVQAERLRQVGEWLRVNGESIYGTHGGVIPPSADGTAVSTRRGPTHYLHVLDDVSDCVKVRGAPNYIARATWLQDASSVGLERGERETTLTLTPSQRGPFSTVIKLEP
jgi:alpha-L-fucosidase